MKAIVQRVYGTPDVLRLVEIAMPPVGDDDVLLRVVAAGVDRGAGLLMTGRPYLVRIMGLGVRAPKASRSGPTWMRSGSVRGLDVAGRVEAVGKNVTAFKPNDEVFGICAGSFAEYACARVDELERKPSNLTFEEAAAVPISACTALQALRDKGQLEAGQSVLVIGAGGGVGIFAVQIAKAFGARVSGVCGTDKVDLVRSIGADEVIDYTRDEFADGKRRFDLILDTGGSRPLRHLRRALMPRGTLVLVGGEGGRWFGGIGRSLWALTVAPFVSHKLLGLLATEKAADLRVLRELIEARKLRPIIDRTYPLRDVPDAMRRLAKGQLRGKLVISVLDAPVVAAPNGPHVAAL